MTNSEITEPRQTSRPAILSAFRDLELWLMLALTVGFFCTRPTTLPLRGEETRRGLIAREMLTTGDWLVPMQQGAPRLTKPPLHYWLIAIVGKLRGEVDTFAIRLPSILAIVLTAVVIYLYSRQFGAAMFAFGSSVAFVSMAQVIQIGRLGEMEAVFTLLVSSSLFVWHWAFEQRRSAWIAWTAGYLLCGLAALVKGPQAPVYFMGGTAVYLTLSGRIRALFRIEQVVGFLLAVAVVAAWVVPYLGEMSWSALTRIFVGETAIRVVDTGWGSYLSHLVEFPVEVCGCLLPWSPLLFAYLHKPFREGLQNNAAAVRLAVICVAIALPTVWLPAGGRTRYLMPVFPLCAILIGAVVERISVSAKENELAKFWRNYLSLLGAACVVAAIALVVVHFGHLAPNLTQSSTKLAMMVAFTLIVGAYILMTVRRSSTQQFMTPFVIFSAFWGLIITGPAQDFIIRRGTNEAARIVQLREELDLRVPLRSLDLVHHFFAFHFGQPIPVVKESASLQSINQGEYFCFDRNHTQIPLPFAWEKIAEISCDRVRLQKPLVTVVVGRRTADSVAAQSRQSSGGHGADDAQRR